MRNLVLAGLLAASILPAAVRADHLCNQGDTRCSAEGIVQWCVGVGQFSQYEDKPDRARCQSAVTTSQDQKLCSPGDQKCGPSNTILECKAGFGGGASSWSNTYRRCQ